MSIVTRYALSQEGQCLKAQSYELRRSKQRTLALRKRKRKLFSGSSALLSLFIWVMTQLGFSAKAKSSAEESCQLAKAFSEGTR